MTEETNKPQTLFGLPIVVTPDMETPEVELMAPRFVGFGKDDDEPPSPAPDSGTPQTPA